MTQINSYDDVLKEYLQGPYNTAVFNSHLSIVTMQLEDTVEEEIVFPLIRRLIVVAENHFIYGDLKHCLEFSSVEDATHIYYDTSATNNVITIPLMLKISSDSFSVYCQDGWVEYNYPISKTIINFEALYRL